MSQLLQDKIAVVTGASRGIGEAVAERYAREGAHVILIARTVSGLEALDDRIKAFGGSATLVPCDLRDFDKIDHLGAVLAERFGRVDVLLGNAGILGHLSPLTHTPPDEWQRILDVNLTANYRLLRSLEPLLKASDAGRVLFVSSQTASEATAYWGVYGISKAALEHMVRIYAQEIDKTAICVNMIDPGAIKTKMLDQFLPGAKVEDYPSPEDSTDLFVEMVRSEYTRNGVLETIQGKK